jgi:hypothetical protein
MFMAGTSYTAGHSRGLTERASTNPCVADSEITSIEWLFTGQQKIEFNSNRPFVTLSIGVSNDLLQIDTTQTKVCLLTGAHHTGPLDSRILHVPSVS